jgi:type III restriction enzyme
VDPLFSRIIINEAYEEPSQHLNLLREGLGEDETLAGRRPAGYYLGGRSEADQQVSARAWRELVGVNKIRERVGRWRAAGYPGVTSVTKALLDWWQRRDKAGINLFFCQLEAAETIIWLVEAPESDRAGLGEITAPDPFTRYCTKMATGSGKTTVMAMLAAWSVINKTTNRGDARFADAVLVVCPNLTVKERLQVLHPSNPQNEYDSKALLLPGTDFKERLSQGRFQISNWHQLAVQEDRPGKILQRGQESDAAFCRRVLRDLGSKEDLLVFNDEAHHAYRKNPDALGEVPGDEGILEIEDAEEYEREATVWVEGLDRVQRNRKIRLCVDLSATPYYIARSGFADGTPFPWIVSDFGLVDAVECGIVKIPRVPRGDDSGEAEPRYLHLWEHIREKLPKRALDGDAADAPLVQVLMEAEGALRSLGYLWTKTFKAWRDKKSEVPPCMIVVCNNTRTAEVVSNFISGPDFQEEFRNAGGQERTLRIDSALLRKAEAEGEGNADARAQLLRKKVATVGKPGPPEAVPGGQIRCVVSVAMLSEGWDARNVTQILGLRAFSSQLLCEQVIGRGLRRSSYDELSEPEYVDIYGVPFQLLPVQRQSPGGEHKPATNVRALPERIELEIEFPRVVGFFMDVGTELEVDESKLELIELSAEEEPSVVEVGEAASYYSAGAHSKRPDPTREVVRAADVYGRVQTTVYKIAHEVLREISEEHRPHVFKRVLDVVKRYVDSKVRTRGVAIEMIGHGKYRDQIVQNVRGAIRTKTGEAVELPIYDLVQPVGSTRYVSFLTRKPIYLAAKSHINAVVCDPAHNDVELDRLWEYRVAKAIDEHAAVRSFAKNDHLDFTITYTFQNDQSRYLPDFLVRVEREDGSETMLILEVKGQEDNRDRAKYTFARRWVDGVNRDGRYARWAFDVCRDPGEVRSILDRVAGVG